MNMAWVNDASTDGVRAVSYTQVFDHTHVDEDERLRSLGDALNAGTFRRLDMLCGARLGLRCLDIGTGTGTLARQLANICPDGQITATDLDVRNVDAPGVRVVRHNVATDDFAEGSFDLIVARWVFMHLPSRDAILTRVSRWLAPGGCLLIEDAADFAMLSSPNPRIRTMAKAVTDVLADIAGTDCAWARTFPAPLARLGLDRLGTQADVAIVSPSSPMNRFLVGSVERMERQLVDSGRVDSDQLRDWYAELNSKDCWDLGLVNVAAWGFRPGC
jgi:SAM-dependent methyltransferase